MATAHIVAGRRDPLASCGRLSSLTQDMLSPRRGQFVVCRVGANPTFLCLTTPHEVG